jgi:hypothetical protein
MRAIVAAVIAMALGFGIYAWQTGRLGGGAGGGSPTAIVDTVAVKTDLLSMANAMKQQFALEAKYVSLEDLRKRGVPVPERRGAFVYSADVTDMDFTIKATYEGDKGAPTLTIGPDMVVKEIPAK